MGGWIKTAKVGDKVVCIEDKFEGDNFYAETKTPAEGEIYTIRGIFAVEHGGKEHICIRLMEIVNPEADYEIGIIEPGFLVRRFRPIQNRDADISIFQRMLNTAPAKVGEVA